MTRGKVRVLLADDSALMRRELKRLIEGDLRLEVVATARDGVEAVEQTKAIDPDVVALDVNMPRMDGMTALQHIMAESPRPVVMVSSLTQKGALAAYEALELGAVDFVGKPDGTVSKLLDQITFDLRNKLYNASTANRGSLVRVSRIKRPTRPPRPDPTTQLRTALAGRVGGLGKIVVIGQSTGGPATITDIISKFPADLGVPVIIVQHMPGTFTPSFAQRLGNNCNIPFCEVKTGQLIEPGRGYLAPGDFHLALGSRLGDKGFLAHISTNPREAPYVPSVDVAMESVFARYGPKTIGVLLTGMGDDGARAMTAIRAAGGHTIAESEETAIVFGMPKAAIERGGAEFILPAYAIGEKIVALARN
ncbi:MAG: chemotaxis response regulator protein-glutamate methylesterase [Terriglobia bacterium]|jgi:two-component system chemotaxis response regulator CheB